MVLEKAPPPPTPPPSRPLKSLFLRNPPCPLPAPLPPGSVLGEMEEVSMGGHWGSWFSSPELWGPHGSSACSLGLCPASRMKAAKRGHGTKVEREGQDREEVHQLGGWARSQGDLQGVRETRWRRFREGGLNKAEAKTSPASSCSQQPAPFSVRLPC